MTAATYAVEGGPSPLIVTSRYAMAVDEVRQAVENAGFDLTDIEGRRVPQRRQSPSTRDGETRSDTRRQTKSSNGGVNS